MLGKLLCKGVHVFVLVIGASAAQHTYIALAMKQGRVDVVERGCKRTASADVKQKLRHVDAAVSLLDEGLRARVRMLSWDDYRESAHYASALAEVDRVYAEDPAWKDLVHEATKVAVNCDAPDVIEIGLKYQFEEFAILSVIDKLLSPAAVVYYKDWPALKYYSEKRHVSMQFQVVD